MLLKQQSEKLEEEYDQLNQQLESSKVQKKYFPGPECANFGLRYPLNKSPSIGISISIRLGKPIALSRYWIEIYPPFIQLGPGPALQSSPLK